MLKRYLFFMLISVFSLGTFAQGTETFTNIPAANSGYTERVWTGDNGLQWKATDARTDLSIVNGNRAILIREGSLTCNGMPNGITKLTFSYQQQFTGTDGILEIYINGTKVGTTPPSVKDVAMSYSLDNINISGSFNLEIRQTTIATGSDPKLRIAIDDVVWTAYTGAACATPTAQPTSLNLTSTPQSISGTYTEANPEVDNYLIVRSTSSTLSANPVDGVNYSAGQSLGGGTVVAVTTENNFVENNLTPSTLYYYFIFARNDNCTGGPVYLTTAPLTSSISTTAIPACTTPANSPSGLNLIPANNSIAGSFSSVASANRYLVIISTASTLSATPANGTTYSEGASFGGGKVVSYNGTTSFNATGLTSGVTYYFFVYAGNSECTGEPFYSTSSSNASATTTTQATGIPAGYYDGTDALTCQPLKTKLRDIISTGYNQLSYAGVWTAYKYTDIHRNDANTADIIWDIYSDNPNGPEPYTYTFGTDQCGTYGVEGDCYNREHSTPKSWFADATPMYTDVNHLYPTDGKVNGVRSNYPYGEVTTVSYTSQNGSKLGIGNNFGYTKVVFEPINEYKGDLARTSFYMATRYQNEIIANNWSANGTANEVFLSSTDQPNADKRKLQIYDDWYLKTIFKWSNQDPVSQKEIDRNNAVYYKSGQNNRNPFIDHPEYIAKIWECTGVLPVTITDFTAILQNDAVVINWYATYETNFKQFEIERSTNSTDFIKVGTVQGKNLANYSFTDDQLPSASIVYYRLKMIDIDGKYEYSKIVQIKLNTNFTKVLVYPNPVSNVLKIQLKTILSENSQLQIVDLTGRTVQKTNIPNRTNVITQDVSSLPSGRYFIRITNNSEVINSSFIIMK